MKQYAAAALLLGALNQNAQADFIPFETWPSEDIGLADMALGYKCPNEPLGVGVNCTFAPDKKYAVLEGTSSSCTAAGPNACFDVDTSVTPHRFNYHAEIVKENGDKRVNFQLISKESFNKNRYISIEAEMNTTCYPSSAFCHAGLVLYNGEQNYRSIALGSHPLWPQMHIKRVTPCEEKPLVSAATGNNLAVNPGSIHKLRMDYYGHENGGKWVYFVDDVVQWITAGGVTTEPPGQQQTGCYGTQNKTYFENDPHVGLWFVGDITEMYEGQDPNQIYGHFAEGDVGPISIYTNEYSTQSQLSQTDGLRLTNSYWVAQLINMDGATNNITMARLYLIDQENYTIEAYTNNNGVPGSLINSTPYKGSGNGLQYVPLWVPGHFDNMWIVVKGRSAAADVGTTTDGVQPLSPNSFLYTTNSGASWAPLIRNLTFATYTRK